MAMFRFEHCVADVVLDGDTFWADIDLGVRCRTKQKVRVRNVHAVELKEPGGPEAKEILATLVPPGTSLEITSQRLVPSAMEPRSGRAGFTDPFPCEPMGRPSGHDHAGRPFFCRCRPVLVEIFTGW